MSSKQARQTRVVLSIKPEYAMRIFSGQKHFEYRKVIFRSPDVRSVVVYASAPLSQVIGEFEVVRIHHEDVVALWRQTGDRGGISRESFISYFRDQERGFAIEVGSRTLYEEPQDLASGFGMRPPQSFAYLPDGESDDKLGVTARRKRGLTTASS